MKNLLGYRPLFAAAATAVALLYGLAVWLPSKTPAQPAALPAAALADGAEVFQQPQLFTYIEVTNSCGPYFTDPCVNARSGPGEAYPSVLRLRTGVVLKTAGTIEAGGRTWYKITFDDEWLRYPERAVSSLFVAADYVAPFTDRGPQELPNGAHASTTKRIVIDRSEQTLYAYDGDVLFMQEIISTGLEFTPTPRGVFSIFKKTPSRYMQGPIPGISQKEYDLPGVPWNLYFTEQGGVIHGAYWHNHFGEPWSNGCVNLPPEKAKTLYEWADIGTPVFVHD